MAEYKPLILLSGKLKTLPAGDTIAGVLFRINSTFWQANPLSESYTTDKEKILINGANFISDGGDAVWSGYPNGYGRYNLYIGQEAADSLTRTGTYDVNTGIGYGVFKSSTNLSFLTAVGGGALRSTTRDPSPEAGIADSGGVVIGNNAGRNIPLFNASILVGDAAGENLNRIFRCTIIGNKGFRPSGTTRYLWKVTSIGSYNGYNISGNMEHIISIGHETMSVAPASSNAILIGDYAGYQQGASNSIILGHYRTKGAEPVPLNASYKNNIISIGHGLVPVQTYTINFPTDYRLSLGELTTGTSKLTVIQKAANSDTASFVAKNEAAEVFKVVGDNVVLEKVKSKSYLATDSNGNIVEAVSPVLDKIYALGSVSGTVNIDVSLGTIFTATLTGTTTLTFSNPPTAGYEKSFVLAFTNDQTINLPSNTKYAEATAPDVTSTNYQIICSIDSSGQLTIYGILNDIIDTP